MKFNLPFDLNRDVERQLGHTDSASGMCVSFGTKTSRIRPVKP
jgi:hypothetical protein